MRVIVILFLGITVVALVLKFLPGSESRVEAQGGGPPAAEAQTPVFLEPPARPTRASEERAAPAPAPRTASRAPLAPAADLNDSPLLAGAMLHLQPEAFRAHLSRRHPDLNPRRVRLLLSFSQASHGRAEQAVDAAGDLGPGEGVSEAEFALLQEAVSGRASAARPASKGAEGSVRRAMELALLAREGRDHLQARRWKQAARALSTVLLEDVRSPWPSDFEFTREWAALLNEAQASHRWDPAGSWPSFTIEVQAGDNLSLVRKRAVERAPGLLICTGLIARVNGVGDRYLQPGEELRIPTDPVSTLVDLEARHVLYLFGEEVAAVWPVAIGALGSDTPPGAYVVGELIPEPPWFRTGRPMVPYGDPENELGTRWIGWNRTDGGSTHYGFHGTWEPERIGEAVSDGCVRLRNEDVEVLYRVLPRGSAVLVQP